MCVCLSRHIRKTSSYQSDVFYISQVYSSRHPFVYVVFCDSCEMRHSAHPLLPSPAVYLVFALQLFYIFVADRLFASVVFVPDHFYDSAAEKLRYRRRTVSAGGCKSYEKVSGMRKRPRKHGEHHISKTVKGVLPGFGHRCIWIRRYSD